MAYINLGPAEQSLDDLIQRALDRMGDEFPGWVPREHHLEVVLIEEAARIASVAHRPASQVPARIFERYGESVVGLPRNEGARATVTVKITALNDDGYSLPSETAVSWPVTGDEIAVFKTVEPAVIVPGAVEVEVEAEAEQVGSAYNGFGPGGAADIVEGRVWVDSVEFVDESGGGDDAESVEAYRDRLSEELRLLADRAILPGDFELLAARTPGVARALALDGYDPETETEDNERMVTVVPLDADGLTPAQAVLDDLTERLEGRREVNFIVHTGEPTYTPVDVEFTVRSDGARSEGPLLAGCEEAVRDLLSPAMWGGGDESPARFRVREALRLFEVASVLAQVRGVLFVVEVKIDGQLDDFSLAGRAPLPAPFDEPEPSDPWSAASTVSGTVET